MTIPGGGDIAPAAIPQVATDRGTAEKKKSRGEHALAAARRWEKPVERVFLGCSLEVAYAFQICTWVPSKSDSAEGLACQAVVIAWISSANTVSSSDVDELVDAALTA